MLFWQLNLVPQKDHWTWKQDTWKLGKLCSRLQKHKAICAALWTHISPGLEHVILWCLPASKCHVSLFLTSKYPCKIFGQEIRIAFEVESLNYMPQSNRKTNYSLTRIIFDSFLIFWDFWYENVISKNFIFSDVYTTQQFNSIQQIVIQY